LSVRGLALCEDSLTEYRSLAITKLKEYIPSILQFRTLNRKFNRSADFKLIQSSSAELKA